MNDPASFWHWQALGLAPGGGSDVSSVRAFLMKALDAPHAMAIKNAIDLLHQVRERGAPGLLDSPCSSRAP